jgi:hypothetical protein
MIKHADQTTIEISGIDKQKSWSGRCGNLPPSAKPEPYKGGLTSRRICFRKEGRRNNMANILSNQRQQR